MSRDETNSMGYLSLAADFPAAHEKTWRNLVEKALGSAAFENLISVTYDRLEIEPLYTLEDWQGMADPLGFPGATPYVRGGTTLGAAKSGWDIRQAQSHPDPEVANQQIKEDLEKGATSILLEVDPTGDNGVMIQSLADLETTLNGVHLDLAAVTLSPTGPSLPLAALLMTLLEQRGAGPKQFAGSFGADPLSSLAVNGKLIVPLPEALARTADLACHVSRKYLKARAITINAVRYHSAGATEAQEIACSIASAVAYLRSMTKAGLTIDEACHQIAFNYAADTNFFLTIAKLRAARRLWGRVAEASGATGNNCASSIGAMASPRMMSRCDPWVNILRVTVACFGAGLGGASSITTLPFDSALGLPGAVGCRIARNTQIILQEESFIDRVIDPAGGSLFLDSLTNRLAETAWSLFQDIERAGGMGQALTSGIISKELHKAWLERAKNISRREDSLIGVSEFADINEAKVGVGQIDIDAIGVRARKRAADSKSDVKNLPTAGNGLLTAALVASARNKATVAAMASALAGKPTTIRVMPQYRLAEDFEKLRHAADAHAAKHGSLPKIFLANLGTMAQFTPRSTFAKHFFGAGGVEAVAADNNDDTTTIVSSFKQSGAAAAVICSCDEIYKESAAPVAEALKKAGTVVVYLSGRGGLLEHNYRRAGVDEFIYSGSDVLEILRDLHRQLGI